MRRWKRVVLVGVSGTGKTTVGRLLAAELAWRAIDTDTEIEADMGEAVPSIFARHGEAAFRQAERSVLGRSLQETNVVIATGGGAVSDEMVWQPDLLGDESVLTVALDAAPAVSLARLQAQVATEGTAFTRPLLAGSEPAARIRDLKAVRQSAYDRADLTLPVDHVEPARIARELAAIVRGESLVVTVDLPHTCSRIMIQTGGLSNLGSLIGDAYPSASRVWVVTDDGVGLHHLSATSRSIGASGFSTDDYTVARGEGSKSVAGAAHLYDWLLANGVERGDVVVALGGGVVGDLAGFVAATTLRGLGLVQVPTTLLAMVDSSVGGKTGINHPVGKNLIGTFFQPPMVVIDPRLLDTLPPRELTSGWSEIIKHGVIQPSSPGGERSDLTTFLERNATALVQRKEPALSYLIQRNVELKARVVEVDEREGGLRAMLNFGHTIGHAVEAAGYQLLHGEAVAVGMRAATRLGEKMGTCDGQTVERVDRLLDRYGLPANAVADHGRVSALLTADKKRVAGKQRWVLPRRDGGVELRDDVPEEMVRTVLDEVLVSPDVPSESEASGVRR